MSYIVIPKELFTNPTYIPLSAEAKLLYGFLSDRASLSKRNGKMWETNDGETFFYFSQNEVMRYMACGHDKATALMRELENIGLIKRVRQGLGRAHKLILKVAFQSPPSSHTEMREFSNSDSGESASNNTEGKNTYKSYIESPHPQDRWAVEQLIKHNIYYDVLAVEIGQPFVDTVTSIIVDAICTTAPTVQIAGEKRSKQDVCNRFTALTDLHIRYVHDRIRNEKQVIFSPKGYILKHLFEADHSMDIYYESRLSYDEAHERRH